MDGPGTGNSEGCVVGRGDGCIIGSGVGTSVGCGDGFRVARTSSSFLTTILALASKLDATAVWKADEANVALSARENATRLAGASTISASDVRRVNATLQV